MLRTTTRTTEPAPALPVLPTGTDPLLQLQAETRPADGPGAIRCVGHSRELALGEQNACSMPSPSFLACKPLHWCSAEPTSSTTPRICSGELCRNPGWTGDHSARQVPRLRRWFEDAAGIALGFLLG